MRLSAGGCAELGNSLAQQNFNVVLMRLSAGGCAELIHFASGYPEHRLNAPERGGVC